MEFVINAISGALGMVVLGLLAWYGLHAYDAIRAWRYNRRMARHEAARAAFYGSVHHVMGEYAQRVVYTYRAVLATPDRPADPIRVAIDAITGAEVAAPYPKGQ